MKLNVSKFSELQQRIMTGILGAITVIASLMWNEWSYFLLFFLISIFSLWEFYRLLGIDGNSPLRTFGTFNGAFLFILSFLIEKFGFDSKYYLLMFISLAGAYFIKLYRKADIKPFANIAFTFLGVMYVGVPFALLNGLIFWEGNYHFEVVLGSLFILWASDTGAYFSGKNFGKRKLFQRISPKKTWEGSIGGGIFALCIGAIWATLFPILHMWQWLAISAIIVVAGTYGDLVESLFKRSISIKDSGSVLPGHGGFLDRFDGLLIASPFIVVFLKLFPSHLF
ncbi:phosphatidate cytidylyltransferase [Hugenholtzia roseola]|uniref:phosphatidate cytidylyltransferase n=1 Tax=Hugenholtzia roseola TaxID=1002 RepID=UPI0003FB35FA|nr:phosphatidate cytidylyltransferase [Hugenholtzia roseola]